ncbi:hypothetical protein JXA02_05630 [candidate division KSB1 bacterium]|nr:hypothetical protein [candidate division KSB1 bacterium]RQW07880.1 MAG: hypothetical protein EH222_06445 [candidate division KSB1 bacterium]
MNEGVESTDFSLILDAGGFSKSYGTTAQLQTDFLLKGLSMLRYDGINLSGKDFSEGGEFLQALRKKHGLDFISANIVYAQEKKQFVEPFIIKKLTTSARTAPFKKLTVGILGLCDEKESLLHARFEEAQLQSLAPVAAAQEIVRKLDKQTDLVILLYNGRFNALEALLSQIGGIDIVIMGGEYYRAEQYSDENVIIASSPSLGKYFATLAITIDKDRKITASQKRRIPLDESIQDDPKLAKLVADFDREKENGAPPISDSR